MREGDRNIYCYSLKILKNFKTVHISLTFPLNIDYVKICQGGRFVKIIKTLQNYLT